MTPLIASNLPQTAPPPPTSNAAPRVSPIDAVFVQAEFATHYTVLATDADGDRLTYSWRLHPPANDPGCNNLGQLTSSTDELVWRHGDQHGCDHNKEGPRGHQGTVDVIVSDGTWVCSATYSGTETGLGPPPGQCTRI